MYIHHDEYTKKRTSLFDNNNDGFNEGYVMEG